MVTDHQVRKLMAEHEKHGNKSLAALRAGMDRKTADKYIREGKLPSAMKSSRTWRTRKDPFSQDWLDIVQMLDDAPELEAKALFEYWMAKARRYHPGQLRTFQRKVRRWRAQHGSPKEVFFPQAHVPGEAMQVDFTHCAVLGVTIAGEPFDHMLCNCTLPFSNWNWPTVVHSESLPALRKGVQSAVFRLGRVPTWLQTDNSTAATHRIGPAGSGERGFNRAYEEMVTHLGMKPRTIAVGASEQNGDVEASNGALKRRIKQHLLLRGSRDFASAEAYQTWLHGVLEAANALRNRVAEELAAMRPLVAKRLVEYDEIDVRVSAWSTIRVQHNAYSLPSRLIREQVRVRIYEERLEVYFAGRLEASMPRLKGRNGHAIDYRHIIFWLLKKPGAFARYRYRESLFPSLVFRRTFDRLVDRCAERTATMHYLRILNLAATTMEADVETALVLVLEDDTRVPTVDMVRPLVILEPRPTTLTIDPYEPTLDSYDSLMGGVGCL